MTTKEKETCLRIACAVDVFKPQEIETLAEVLDGCENGPQSSYILFKERLGDAVIGFIIIDRVAITEFSWDIYWLVVDKQYQGKGYGKNLLKRVESYILEQQDKAILRVETSTKKEFSHARNLYSRQGFREVGRIANFYAPADDLIIYSKEISRVCAPVMAAVH